MTTPEQPGTPALTRKQMRDIRNTGANPVIVADAAPEAASAPTPEPAPAYTPPAAPLPRAAEPAVVADAPVPDASVDLGVSPLTRRQARQQERIRTASVPVITPEVAAAYAAAQSGAPVSALGGPVSALGGPDTGLNHLFGATQTPQAATPVDSSDSAGAEEPDPAVALFAPATAEPAEAERAVVSPLLGSALLQDAVAPVELPPSFDQLLARGSSGSSSMPNALIVSQVSGASPIVAPVSSTGEVLITGTLNLPEGL